MRVMCEPRSTVRPSPAARCAARPDWRMPLVLLGAGIALAALTMVARAGGEGMTATPREKYILFCAGCHGYEGEGGGGEGGTEPVPALRSTMGVFLRDPAGREYLVNVGGVSSAGMRDVEAAMVLNYILLELGEQSLPDDFVPYTTEEISALRRRPLDDAVATRMQMRERLLARGYTLPPYQWER